MSIASEIIDLRNNLSNAKTAVVSKGGTVGDTGLAGLASEIESIPTGETPEVEKKDINFYDYDGTRVASWTLAELSEKTVLPDNPSHTGLIADGWNWTLQQLKNQNTKMNVGQHYTPVDGKTHLFVSVDETYNTPHLGLGINGSATIDWGDGSTSTVTGSDLNTNVESIHTYENVGSYEVIIDVTTGSTINIRGNSATSHFWRGSINGLTVENKIYGSQVHEIWIGNNVIIGSGSLMCPFNWFTKLKKISFSKNTIISAGNSEIFSNCSDIKFVSIPDGATYFSVGQRAGFKYVSLPPSTTRIGVTCLADCQQLEDVFIPNNVTSYDSNCFDYSYKATNYFKFSSNTTTIGSFAFYHNYNMRELDLSSVTAVPTLNTSSFPSASDMSGLVIKVPNNLLNSFKTASQWSSYANFMIGV